MQAVKDGITDYRTIKIAIEPDAVPGYPPRTPSKQRLVPIDSRSCFKRSLIHLKPTLAESFGGPTVVVTNHLPHQMSVNPVFLEDPLSTDYASSLSALIERTQPALWIHGHTYERMDYQVGRTRVACNPCRFPVRGGHENLSFDPHLVLTV